MGRLAVSIAALLPLLPGTPAQAQVTLSVEGGGHFTERVFGYSANTLGGVSPRSRHGLVLGIAAGLPISEDWGIQLGAGLSEKDYHSRHRCVLGGWGEYSCIAENLIPYLEATALADRRLELTSRVSLHLLAGPFLAFQRDSEREVMISNREGSRFLVVSRKIGAFDFGIAGGALLKIGLYGRLGLSIGTVYTHGLRNIDEVKGVPKGVIVPLIWRYYAREGYAVKTRTLTFRSGLMYTIGKGR